MESTGAMIPKSTVDVFEWLSTVSTIGHRGDDSDTNWA